jgi:hypothetical protein
LTTHDFLLAAMLVCLDLYHQAEAERKGRSPNSPASPNGDVYYEDRRDEMLKAVEHCITIWDAVREQSMEAYKASVSLRVMFEKLKAHQSQQAILKQLPPDQQPQGMAKIPRGHPNFGAFPNGTFQDINTDDLPPEQSAAMTLGMLSSGGMSPSPNFGMNMGQAGSGTEKQNFPASIAGLLNDPMTERTGLTPGYSGPDTSGVNGQSMAGAASPFSSMFGQGGAFMGMDGVGGDIDWVSLALIIRGHAKLYANEDCRAHGTTILPATPRWIPQSGICGP